MERQCGVSFEGLPVWLWTLRLAEWSAIYITGTDEVKLRQYHVSTWEFVKHKLVIVEIGGRHPLPNVDLWLISGPLAFIKSWEGRINASAMACWVSDGGRRKPTNSGLGCEWHLVFHARVGGVTIDRVWLPGLGK